MSGEDGPIRDIKAAFTEARKCKGLRHEFFIERLGLEKAKPHNAPHRETPSVGDDARSKKKKMHEQREAEARRAGAARKKEDKAAGKATGKGKKDKGGGKGKKGTDLPAGVTLLSKSQGEKICFKYGSGRCKNAGCKMLHVCQICEGEHPWKECEAYRG